MKGTWGRRMYGQIQKGPELTYFRLVIVMREGWELEEVMAAETQDLIDDPTMYRVILDWMTDELQKKVAQFN